VVTRRPLTDERTWEPRASRDATEQDARHRYQYSLTPTEGCGVVFKEPSLGELARVIKASTCIEASFKRGKGEVGMDEYQVGRIRARYPKARFPNPPVRPVRATFIAHGSRKRELYRKLPFHQLHGLHRGQLPHSLATFVPFSPPSSSGPLPCTRLSRVPTPLPHLTACWALEFRMGFPIPTLHPP